MTVSGVYRTESVGSFFPLLLRCELWDVTSGAVCCQNPI